MRFTDVVTLALCGTMASATMDVSVIASSCAGEHFKKAMTAPGNPCQPGDLDCICSTGFGFVTQYLMQALSANPGSCSASQLTQLETVARQACGAAPPAPGPSGPASVVSVVPPVQTAPVITPVIPPSVPVTTSMVPVTTPIVPVTTPIITPNATIINPTGVFPTGNVSQPTGTPTSPKVFTGAAATAAIGQFVAAGGIAAAAVAFGF